MSSAWSAAEMSGSNGEERAILLARAMSMTLINRVGDNKTISWLSLEVSTSSLQDRALAGPICDPGVARKTRDQSPAGITSIGLAIRTVCEAA